MADQYPVADIDAVHVYESNEYPTSFFKLPDWPLPYLEGVLVPNGMIKDRVRKLAEDIYKSYRSVPRLTFVIIMSGADRFFNEILEAMQVLMSFEGSKLMFTFDYVKVNFTSESEFSITGLNPAHIKDEHVLVVQDIYDTGRTMLSLLKHLDTFAPKSLKTTVLFHRRSKENLSVKFKADFTGFTIPADKFIVGYHLDYFGVFREIPHLCVLNEAGLKEFKK